MQEPWILKKDFLLILFSFLFLLKIGLLNFYSFCVEQNFQKADGFARQQYLIWLKALSRATTKKILQLFYSTFLFTVKLGFVKTYLRKKEKGVL